VEAADLVMTIRPASAVFVLLVAASTGAGAPAHAQSPPPDQRGRIDAERSGFHDAANIRTVFWNYGMVGDYPPNPGNVDLSVFHSAEVPKGAGVNYSDGITPFVLSRIVQRDGTPAYIMETGFRERQELSPRGEFDMRFEPRPGYFQADPNINRGRSPAISNDPRTWPATWPDKVNDPDDPGWDGSWNGYFGKRPAADQESFFVLDDDLYEKWNYNPDSTDATRRGLGLKVQVRGFQWANPQAGNVIFWHYDITNEGTTDYNENIIFGLYMDSGVGGSALSCDGIFESDDDNAFFDRSSGLNLVYTWDKNGTGVGLGGNCERTGYLGYAYLETPGKPFDGEDNDIDGFVDERRDGGPGTRIEGQNAILEYMQTHYDLARFELFYGELAKRPAYRAGVWWTGDEDLDWVEELNDFGGDGVPETGDAGEGDGVPTEGEANFDRTDLNESDQIGLTGFKLNRIARGAGNTSGPVDGIVFYTEGQNWPQRLYDMFTDPVPANRFDEALALNYNIGFLFASGPFTLRAGQTERFSLALAFGADLFELRSTVRTVQQIYNANYQFAVPPTLPTLTAEEGDGFVRLSWDDVAERAVDPVTSENDFEGYRIYRSTDPEFRDPDIITTGRGSLFPGNGAPIAQFDLQDGRRGYSRQTVEGVAYFLGQDTGLRHTWTDTTVVNGQQYYYAVTAYDFGLDTGEDSTSFYPSENAISVSRTPRGGTILPSNVVAVRPNPRALGFAQAATETARHTAGEGVGTVEVAVVNSNLVPAGHTFQIRFAAPSPDSIRARSYSLVDSTTGEVLFTSGRDFDAVGSGPVGSGLLPIVSTPTVVTIDEANTGYRPGSPTNTRLKASYQPTLDINVRRPGYPEDVTITFDDVVRDTGLAIFPFTARPAKFIVESAASDGTTRRLDFRFRDVNNDQTISHVNDVIDIVTYTEASLDTAKVTWSVVLDTVGQGGRGPIVAPRLGDVWDLKLIKPFTVDDVFSFTTTAMGVNAAAAQAAFAEEPYVVPNPYIESASFEPARFAISGRGERRMEFRGLPQSCVVRIYTIRGDLVRTLRHESATEGFEAWNLRTEDNLDVAPGLYVFHVDAPGLGTRIGKFAVIK
jgi:hypothetical protein